MGQAIGAAAAGPVVGDEDGVGPNGAHHHGLQRDGGAAGGHRDPIAGADAVLFGELRMQFQLGLGVLIYQRADTARLGAGEILAHHAASGEVDGKLHIHRIAALAPRQAHETGFAIGMEKPAVFKQPWRAGMF